MPEKAELDRTDRRIIRALQQNGRMTNLDLSAAVNLSPSPCLRRLKALEQSDVIQGYSAQVDPRRYGLPVTVFVRIRLELHSRESVLRFEESVRSIPEILECHLMTGLSDYLLRVLVSDLEDYERFVRTRLHPIGGISSIDSSFVYGVVKRTHVFPDIE